MSLPWAHPLFRAVSGGEWHPGGAAATDRLWRACRAALADGVEPAGERDGGRPLRVVDAGCGEGAAAWRLAADRQTAVALDRTPQPGWRQPPSAAAGVARPLFCTADVRCIPLRDGWADVVLCQCVASLLPQPESFFAEAARVLRPGGALGFSDLMRRGPTASPAACGAACDVGALADGAAVPVSGGCAAGARLRETWERLLREAGFRLLSFADESRELARLAAQLIWHGDGASLHALGLRCASGPAAPGSPASRPGYGVWVAVNARRTT